MSPDELTFANILENNYTFDDINTSISENTEFNDFKELAMIFLLLIIIALMKMHSKGWMQLYIWLAQALPIKNGPLKEKQRL